MDNINKVNVNYKLLLLLESASKIRIATIIGSTKQKKAFHIVDNELSRKGYAVFSCGVWDPPDKEEIRPIIDKAYIRKIDLCDIVACIHKPDGSIGKHTQKDLNIAIKLEKTILYYNANGAFLKSASVMNQFYFEGLKE